MYGEALCSNRFNLRFEEDLLINDTISLWQKEVTKERKSQCNQESLSPCWGNRRGLPLKVAMQFHDTFFVEACKRIGRFLTIVYIG